MKKAYIILAHKLPQQLYRLLSRLDDKQSDFYVHVDQKVDILPFQCALEPLLTNIYWVERVSSSWASFDLVQATLNGLYAIKASGKPYQRISLLSGQDYPIKSNAYLDAFFQQSPYRIFIEFFTIPNEARWQPRGGQFRLDKYFFGMQPSKRLRAKAINFFASFFPFLRRHIPKHLTHYGGSQWWTIDDKALDYILDYLAKEPSYIDYHQHTFVPDEIFFQTILLNASDPHIRQSISPNPLRYMNWPNPADSHPETLVIKDLQAITESPALFARKFDSTVDDKILDAIDRDCLKMHEVLR